MKTKQCYERRMEVPEKSVRWASKGASRDRVMSYWLDMGLAGTSATLLFLVLIRGMRSRVLTAPAPQESFPESQHRVEQARQLKNILCVQDPKKIAVAGTAAGL